MALLCQWESLLSNIVTSLTLKPSSGLPLPLKYNKKIRT